MTKKTFVYRDGKIVEIPSSNRKRNKTMRPKDGAGDGRGFSLQLPKYYKYANRFVEHGQHKGRPCWTTQREAEEIAARARDHGEDLQWDRGGGLAED